MDSLDSTNDNHLTSNECSVSNSSEEGVGVFHHSKCGCGTHEQIYEFSIFGKLEQLYKEECLRPHCIKELRTSSHLLGKLVKRERINMVLVKLNQHNNGYTVNYFLENGEKLEDQHFPYSRGLLDYLDNEELPSYVLDYWDRNLPQLFYCGCVFVKIIDYRDPLDPRVRHVMLKPHSESLINDANLLVLGNRYSMDDRISIESALVNNIQNPLCLDPLVETGIKRFLMYQMRNIMNTKPLCSTVRKRSLSYLNRMKNIDLIMKQNSHLASFIAKKRLKAEHKSFIL